LNKKRCVAPVHGTFDPVPDWYIPGSVFANAVTKRLHSKRFFLDPLFWTAKNTFRSRYAGALILRRRIKHRISECDRLYLISHSHGGNVSVKATNIEALASVRHITIGTPFLKLEKQDLEITYGAFLALMFYFGLAPWSIYISAEAIGSLAAYLPSAASLASVFRIFSFITGLVLMFLTSVFFICIGLMAFLMISHAISHIRTNERDRQIRKFVNIAAPANKMLCIYTQLDEAFWALKASTILLAAVRLLLIAALLILIAALFYPGNREFKLETISLFFGEFGLRGALMHVPACKACKPSESPILISAFFFFPAALIMSPVLVFYILAKLILFRFAFGMFDLPTALSTRVVVSRVPTKYVGQVDSLCVRLSRPCWTRLRLKHTTLVRDEKIAHEVMRWIKEDAVSPLHFERPNPIRRWLFPLLGQRRSAM
jgi:hypothetical protein